MDWVKVTVRHGEFLFSDASDVVFRAYIRSMLLASALELVPNSAQTQKHLGKKPYRLLLEYLEKKGLSLDHILGKVMEDVLCVKENREKGKQRQAKYRESSNALHNVSHNAIVTGAEKIREDKIREERIGSKEPLTNEYAKDNNKYRQGKEQPVDNPVDKSRLKSERPLNRSAFISHDGKVQKFVEETTEGLVI